MAKEAFYDINEVCRLLNTTSRTLRYYEEKGIIQSTKSDFSSRRQYTSVQIDQIRHVIILRTLGLSVKTIAELQRSGKDLKTTIEVRRAEIMAIIDRKYREINILNEAICLIDRGKSIFENPPSQSFIQTSAEWREIAQK
jgi:DNA-binding transcriptional MerR regulator